MTRQEPICVGTCKICTSKIYHWDDSEPVKEDTHELCEMKMKGEDYE